MRKGDTLMNTLRWLFAAAALMLAVGCRYPLPPGYVKVDPPRDVKFKAVSAEGSALTLRTEKNPENGDLAFWEKAITTRMTDVRGYKLANRKEVKHSNKTPGVELVFDYSREGMDYTYLVTLFIRMDRVYVFEAAGLKDKLAGDLDEIRKAIEQWPM